MKSGRSFRLSCAVRAQERHKDFCLRLVRQAKAKTSGHKPVRLGEVAHVVGVGK